MARPRIVAFSGAGLSADSGLSTFRGSGGLWNGVDPRLICYHPTWKQNAGRVHQFYNALRREMLQAEPHSMHRLLARWEERHDAYLMTQNIDRLLEAAGASRVLHVHGCVDEMLCEACGTTWTIGAAAWDPETDRCRCGSRRGVKPGVVFFHERAPRYADMTRILRNLGPADILVVIGTDGAVVPIGSIVASTAARTILATRALPENPEPGMVRADDFDAVLMGRAADLTVDLDALVETWLGNPDCRKAPVQTA